MKKQMKRDAPTSVRLTADDKIAIQARAAAEGKAVSKYIEGILLGEVQRPRPTLAAAGSLMSICRALMNAVETGTCDAGTRAFAQTQAELLFELLRQHGHEGYGDDCE